MRKDYAQHTYRRRRFHFSFMKFLFSKGPMPPLIGAFVIFFAIPFLLFLWISKDLPRPNEIATNAKYSTTLLDRHGKTIYQVFDDKNIVPVELKDLHDYTWQATVAIEDKDFFRHGGFSFWGIARAMIRNVLYHRSEGGSTLTQQLIKNTLLTPEKTPIRKLREFILAVELERRYTKEEILEMYLNQTPYGGTSYGIESAAQQYFDKHAKDLTLLESVVLAGFPQNPSIYSPFIGSPTAYIERSKAVIRRMREDRHITKDQEKELLSKLTKIKFSKRQARIPAAHFVFYVKNQLDKLFSNDTLYKKGFIIKTTLDLDLQNELEKIAQGEIENAKGLDISNAAIVAIDPKTGEVRAMVGSVDFNNTEFGKFNAATGLRQPGSTLKPFTYALALEKDYNPASIFMDVPTDFSTGKETGDQKPYIPVNYDAKYRGPIQLRFALGNSLNVPAVKALSVVGVDALLKTLYDLGLSTMSPTTENLNRFGLSLTLGGGEVRLVELVGAYGALANKGVATPLSSVVEIRDYKNKVVYKSPKPKQKKVFSEEIAFIISHILSDNNARMITFGANSYLNIPGRTVAAKTGTTDDKRDNWTIGYTKDLVIGVWVGNNDNSKMNQTLASGVSGAAPIWHRAFSYAFKKGYKDGIFEKPKNVEAIEVDAFFGGLPKDDKPKRSEYFVKGTEPKEISSFYRKLKVSKSGNKLANSIEIASGNFDEKDFYFVEEIDPVSQDGKNRWQEGINKWAAEQSDEKWKYPTETSDTNSEDISIEVKKPGDKQRFDNTHDIDILARAISMKSIKSFKLFINGELKKETSQNVFEERFNLGDGVYKIRFEAVNDKDRKADREITIGVNRDPYPTATPTPAPTSAPTNTPSPTPTTPTVTPT